MSGLGINHRAVKLVLSTLPTVINWHLPATTVPLPASHMLYDKKIRPLNERKRGDRKSSKWRWRYSEGGGFGGLPTKDAKWSLALEMEKETKGRVECRKLYFAAISSGAFAALCVIMLETYQTSCASCRVDGFPFSMTNLHIIEEKKMQY